jgi:hypothetical protein
MNKIKYIAIIITIFALIAHVGCMTTKSPAPGGLSGVVTDIAGNYISAATVSTTEGKATSDIQGKWSLQGLNPRIVEIKAEHDKFEPQILTVEVQAGKFVEDVNFALAAKGELSNVRLEKLSSTRVKITFDTKYAAKGYVEYGTDGLFAYSTPIEPNQLYTHKFEITDLVPATTYRFRCVAIDEFGRTIKSSVHNLTTNFTIRPDAPVSLAAQRLPNSSAVQLLWRENTDADFIGFNVYKATSILGPFAKTNKAPVMQASFGDSGLEPGSKYYYKVTKISGSGDESAFSDTVSIVIPGYLTKNTVWTAADSPYILTDSLTIAQGAGLVIDKGTTIRFDTSHDPTALYEISVHGTLMIQGTSQEPVSILSNASSPSKKDWAGITFENTADLTASIIKGLKLYHAVNGLVGVAGGPAVRDSGFYNCEEYAIKVANGARDLSIRNVEIENTSVGIEVSGFTAGRIQILENKIVNCFAGIISKNNLLSEVQNNKIYRAINVGIEVENPNNSSKVVQNTIGWGSSGIGVRCSGMDEIRRNTVQSSVCLEAHETCGGIFRSNLLLVDKDKSHVGFMYSASKAYSANTAANRLTIEYNAIWSAVQGTKKYCNSFDGSALAGFSNDFFFADAATGPALVGGSPFASPYDMSFSYVPISGSPLFGAGYDFETIGAENVAN